MCHSVNNKLREVATGKPILWNETDGRGGPSFSRHLGFENGEKVHKMASGYAHGACGACAQCSPNTIFFQIRDSS